MTPIPIERWGKDHWSTLAYAETCTVDYDGYLDMRHLRTTSLDRYPTRLKDGEMFDHSDLDCLRDAEAAGLLTIERATQRNRDYSIRQLTYQVALTDLGKVVCGKLRAHKSDGGNWATFDPGPTLGWWAASSRGVRVT